jgi:uncharacterized membrane protein (TIGR01666 family)
MDYLKEYKSFISSHYLSDGVRITFGIAVPSIVLSYFNNISAGIIVSVGAMCVSIADSPGPIHHRRNGMNICNLIVFIISLIIGLAAHIPVLLGALIFIFCFTFSMIGVYGSRATSIGISALLVMVLSIDRKNQGWEIVINSLYILAGGSWYTILSLLLYSFRPYKLAQQALGDCIQSTADYLRTKAFFYGKQPDYDKNYQQLLDQQIAIHEKQNLVRELLFKSRNLAKESTNIGRILVMIFLDIVDLFEVVMTSHQDYKALHHFFGDDEILQKYQGILFTIAGELDDVGIAIKSGKKSEASSQLRTQIKELQEYFIQFRDKKRTAENVEGFISLRQILESIQDIADRLYTLHSYTNYDEVSAKNFSRDLDYDKFITHQDIDSKLLKDNLSLKSNIFRHSLRVSIATIAGYIISKFFPFGHSYWILLTIIVILKPAYSLTKKRNYERLIGTLAGALIGLIILYFVNNRDILFAIMLLFMIATYSFLRTRYLISVLFMTPYILLLFHFLNPHDFKTVITDRLIDTGIGSGIAFLANIFIFPAWEHEQVAGYMITMLQDNCKYFTDIAGVFSGKKITFDQYKLSRKNAFVSLANLSDAFNRMMNEPKTKQKNIQHLNQFVVSNHMLTSHIATLAYYAKPLEKERITADYSSFINATVTRINNAKAILEHEPVVSENAINKEELRTLNEKVSVLTEQRKTELNQGITESETRKKLSALKPIADQFNFIIKIATDLEKLSANLQTENALL